MATVTFRDETVMGKPLEELTPARAAHPDHRAGAGA